MPDKPLLWLGSSRSDIRAFAESARRIAGYELRRVQQGMEPTDWKPMTSVGPGVREIRIDTGTEYRVFYLAKFAEAIYVLHVFLKKGRKTPKLDLELGRQRFQALMAWRHKTVLRKG
jgi:phage-related protein